MLPVINTGSVLKLSAFSKQFAIRQYRCAKHGRTLTDVPCLLAERSVCIQIAFLSHMSGGGWGVVVVGWVTLF